MRLVKRIRRNDFSIGLIDEKMALCSVRSIDKKHRKKKFEKHEKKTKHFQSETAFQQKLTG